MEHKLKVLHLIESLGSGGAERLLFTNLRHLNGFEHDVVTVFPRINYWQPKIEELGISVFSLECDGPRDILRGVRRLRDLISTLTPDLIHTHLWTANVIGRIAGRLEGVPVISSIHNPEYERDALADTTGVSSRKLFAAQQVDRITARLGCKQMIAVSDYVQESAVNRLQFPEDRIKVIYNPLEPFFFEPLAGQLERAKLDIRVGVPILLNVGRLTPQKGFIYIVEAMPNILSAFPETRLLSVGSQADRIYFDRVTEAIDRLGIGHSVSLLGERDDVRSILAAADVFVFPSLFEGMGIALAEAMASGKACVASDIRPLSDIISNKLNGRLIPTRDPALVAEVVIELISNEGERRALGRAAVDRARELFMPIPAAQKLERVYMNVLSKS